MKSTRKWLVGTLTSAVLVAGGIALSKYESSSEEKTISFENPQAVLDEAFKNCKLKSISAVIYDPEFKHSDTYLTKTLSKQISQREIEPFLQNSRKQSPGHYLCVTGVMINIGDGKKRPVFARRELIYAKEIKSTADLENILNHEEVHADEEKNGYDFGNRIIRGEELTILCNIGEIRSEVLVGIGELDAYASQLEMANSAQKKPSRILTLGTRTQLYRISSIVEEALHKGTLTPLERKYAERVIRKHKDTIETLKKHR